jgi:hypothetical protein
MVLNLVFKKKVINLDHTVALPNCVRRNYFEYSKHFEKECTKKVTYKKLSIFGKSREPGNRYRY